MSGEQSPVSAVAARIDERMTFLGLNPFSAAKRAGLGVDYVRDILRGKVKQPSAAKLGKLAIALECDLSYLVSGVDAGVSTPALEGLSTLAPDHKRPVLLEVRHRLLSHQFRDARRVHGEAIGVEAATIPFATRADKQWYELMADESMSAVVPKGSLVHVIELDQETKDGLQDGDLVVVTRRLTEISGAFNVVERSLRRVSNRYPELNIFFMDYFSQSWQGTGEDETDDILRSDPPTHKRTAKPPSESSSDTTAAPGRDRVARAVERVNYLLGLNEEGVQKELAELQAAHPTPVAKVLRVVTPVDSRGGFGIA